MFAACSELGRLLALIKGISPKMCILCVRVKINKRSFEPFFVFGSRPVCYKSRAESREDTVVSVAMLCPVVCISNEQQQRKRTGLIKGDRTQEA